MSFHSIHWTGHHPADPELRRLLSAGPAALPILLRSGDPVAVGIALDRIRYSVAESRHGGPDPLASDDPERDVRTQVLAVARDVLRQPPSPVGVGPFVGANHASALYAMWGLADASDADLVADALAVATDVNVWEMGFEVAAEVLADADPPSARLLAAVSAVADDAGHDVRLRCQAIGALRDVPGPGVTRLLVRAAGSAELAVQVEAAWGLTLADRLPAHRDLVRRLAASWPDDAPYPAWEVRRELAEDADDTVGS